MHKKEIQNIIVKALENLGIDQMPVLNVSYPPNDKMGDYTTNVAMVVAKILKKSPMELAKEIESRIANHESRMGEKRIIEKAEIVAPGFINFYLKPKLARENLKNILKQKDRYGGSKIGKGKNIVVDYSQPNIAKRMHAGHLRSTIIGQAIYNIYKFEGYKIKGVNHIGDWGTHFGKLIYGYKNFCDKKKLKENFAKEMNRLYVEFNLRAKTDSRLDDIAREETRKFQAGDKTNVKIWKYLVKESLKEFDKIYKILGVKIDYCLGESFYQPMLEGIISDAIKKGVATPSQGAIIIPLDRFNLPPLMIRKTDGATLYGTTDLAAMKYRAEKWKAEKILYVVANEQSGHFMQLFKAGELMGFIKPEMVQHIKYGMVLGEDGKKFSTREGRVILLEELLGEAIIRARRITEEKNPKLTETEKIKIAKTVGIGAVKYNDLSQNRLTDIVFNWDKMLDFRGNSAPYLQYTYARIKSILRKAKIKEKIRFNPELLKDERELALLRQMAVFDEIILRAGEECMPNIIADYIYKLANNFNAFYENVQVLSAQKDLRVARLGLIFSVAIVIKNGLKLLGIETLEKM